MEISVWLVDASQTTANAWDIQKDMLQPQSHWFALWQLKVMLLFLGSIDEILTLGPQTPWMVCSYSISIRVSI